FQQTARDSVQQKLLDDASLKNSTRSTRSSISTASSSSNILLEVVGATALQEVSQTIDTFCLVKVNDKEVHRTKTIPNDYQPIFTCKTNALCLLKHTKPEDQVLVQLCRPTAIALFNVIGSVSLTFDQLVNGDGKRQEFNILKDDKTIRLALRFREATQGDLLYFSDKKQGGLAVNGNVSVRSRMSLSAPVDKDHAADIDFKNVTKKNLLQQHQKTVKVDNGKETAHRVFPGPDPDDPDNTTFMTQSQMDKFLTEPSKHWVEAGWGDFGAVYLEVLGCDTLPNMDMELVDGLTDPFAAIVFEDSFLRTPVVFDNLNPRWPTWSQRAFKLNIEHPSSSIFLGVLDYDDNLMDNHDAIGRVVLHLDKFEPDTVYTLKYNLVKGDIADENDHGTVTIRLEVRWKKPLIAVSRAQSYLKPPRFIVNTKTQRSWKTIRYLTRGAVDMTDVTIDSCKLFANELVDHLRCYCYLYDIIFSIWLWRGRIPIDSIAVFAMVTLSLEFPSYLPSIFFYSLAYVLLRKNYCLSTNPSPWYGIKSFRKVAMTNVGFKPRPITIKPGTGAEEELSLALIEEYRMHRVTGFLYETMQILLQVYRVYSKTSPVDISTVSKGGGMMSMFYVDYLTYLHLLLKMLIKYIRALKSFATWQSNSTYRFTVKCLAIATVWALFPFKAQSFWLVRALVWTFFGPWVKLLDLLYIRKFYRTREALIREGVPQTTEEMKEDIASRPNILEPLLKSTALEKMSNLGRVVVEDNVKLRDYREEYFGSFSEHIPLFDTSRYPSVPLPSSSAVPSDHVFDPDKEESVKWDYVAGQKIAGSMIPKQRVKA
ncbi:MAG: hypothetical protein SGILL_007707, partial [Bacillariaceae sp.]